MPVKPKLDRLIAKISSREWSLRLWMLKHQDPTRASTPFYTKVLQCEAQVTRVTSCSVAVNLTLCDPMNCSTPGFAVLHYLTLLKLMSTESRCHPTILSSAPIFFCLQSFPASGSFPMSWVFTSDGQSITALALASVLPMNIQD